MIPPKYKFYISKNGGDKVEVNPHYKELNKKYGTCGRRICASHTYIRKEQRY